MSQRYLGGIIYNPPGGFSGQFGAASNTYLTTSSSAAFAFGTGDFTMEAFVFATASQTDNWIIGLHNNCWLRIGSGGALEFYNSVGSSSIIASGAMPINQWNHVAAVRSGTTLTLYQNGFAVASGTVSSNFSTSVACTIGNQVGFDRRWNGYISNVRVVKGTAVYTSAFTPPSGPLTAITNTSLLTCAYSTFIDGSTNNFTLTNTGGVVLSTTNPFPVTQPAINPALGGAGNGVYTLSQYQQLKAQGLWPAMDPYFRNTTLMLHGNGTNGGQNNTFLDSSANNITITRNANSTQGAFAPYGSNWSNYFDATSNSYLRFTDAGSVLDLPGDFTVEFWAYQPAYATLNGTVNIFASVDTLDRFQIFQESNGFKFSINGSVLITSSFVPSLNTWNHFAITRSGSSVTMWINGASAGTGTSSYSMTCASMMIGGQDRSGVYNSCNAYISNFRLVKGTAVYTATFTPSTTPLTAISGTSLLTCQANRFVDNSGNALSVANGSAQSVQRFSPFAPAIPYDASSSGGSAYFDGDGDYLTFPNSSAFSFGTGSFTIEFWVNSNALNDKFILSGRGAIGSMHITYGGYGGSTVGCLRYVASSTITSGSVVISNNAWNHCAIVRNGSSNITLYVNGVSVGTGTDTNNYSGTAGTWFINANDSGPTAGGAGYIADLRIVKGTAVYTSAFTPPAAPLTAITNTQFLMSNTNASILDSATMCNLETVGNAQVSTSVKKYGTGAMYFDGAGDALRIASSPNLALGTGDFTFECWLYASNLASQQGAIYANSATGGFFVYVDSGSVVVRIYGVSTLITAGPLSNNIWTHVAVTRSGTSVRLFINGTQAGSTATSSQNFVQAISYIGTEDGSTTPFSGYIDDLRITKGVARYVTNFTPPTSQVQDM